MKKFFLIAAMLFSLGAMAQPFMQINNLTGCDVIVEIKETGPVGTCGSTTVHRGGMSSGFSLFYTVSPGMEYEITTINLWNSGSTIPSIYTDPNCGLSSQTTVSVPACGAPVNVTAEINPGPGFPTGADWIVDVHL